MSIFACFLPGLICPLDTDTQPLFLFYFILFFSKQKGSLA